MFIKEITEYCLLFILDFTSSERAFGKESTDHKMFLDLTILCGEFVIFYIIYVYLHHKLCISTCVMEVVLINLYPDHY